VLIGSNSGYYEEMGLLSPSRATKGGHRLYTADEAARVQQVKWLRHMGLGLREIKEYLESAAFSKRRLLHLYGSWLREQVELGEELRARLEAIEAWLGSGQEVPARELMRAMKVMSMLKKPLDLQQRQTSNTGGPGIEPERDR
jgi:DNA-binding transcriptional MerR regulator